MRPTPGSPGEPGTCTGIIGNVVCTGIQLLVLENQIYLFYGLKNAIILLYLVLQYSLAFQAGTAENFSLINFD